MFVSPLPLREGAGGRGPRPSQRAPSRTPSRKGTGRISQTLLYVFLAIPLVYLLAWSLSRSPTTS